MNGRSSYFHKKLNQVSESSIFFFFSIIKMCSMLLYLPICALPQVLEQCVYRQYEYPSYGQPIITSKR